MAGTQAFHGQQKTKTAKVDRSKDRRTPNLPLLAMKNMASPHALAGTHGNHAEVIIGDRWQEFTGDQTTNLHGSLKMHIFKNETWTVDDDLKYTISGQTVDNRVGVHHQTNTNPRFDHFIHTRTEIHDQPQVIHQPTQDTHTISNLLTFHVERHQVTGLQMTANGVKLEFDGLEATEKVWVIDRKENRWQNSPSVIQLYANYVKIRAFVTEVVPVKLNASLSHLKAVASNIAAGIRAAFSAPWGS